MPILLQMQLFVHFFDLIQIKHFLFKGFSTTVSRKWHFTSYRSVEQEASTSLLGLIVMWH